MWYGLRERKDCGHLVETASDQRIFQQNTREHHPRGQILCCRHVRLGSWASRKTSPSDLFGGLAGRFVLAPGLDGGTEGPLGIGDPLRPSPVTFSQKKFILSFDVPKAWHRRGAG